MNMNELTEIAVNAALDAGKAILEIYARDFEVETKSDNSPLTEADKASHEIIIGALKATPYPVLSEESTRVAYEERKEWSTYWLVDPLDGTREFIKKNGEFTVNIAMIEDGRPVMGVVFAPVLDVLYCGMSEVESGKWEVESRMLEVESGMSAWKATGCLGKRYEQLLESAEPLSTSHFPRSTSHLQHSTTQQRSLRVVASRSHCNDETLEFISQLEEQFGPAERVSSGSSLKLCMVAEGSADIYPRIAPTMEWDTAAAHAVVSAAGGAVFEYNSAVPAEFYHCGKLEVESGKLPSTSHFPQPTSHLPLSTNALQPLHYNKQNLLNPYFVVSGLSQ